MYGLYDILVLVQIYVCMYLYVEIRMFWSFSLIKTTDMHIKI